MRLTLLSLTCFVALLFSAPASAQIPDCNSIRSPALGQVCYLDFPLSSPHLRDCNRWNGCRQRYSSIFEMPNGYVLTNFSVHRTGGFGATGTPSCNRSERMTDTISTSEVTSLQQRATSIRGRLRAELNGCQPPTCQRIRAELEAVNETIDTLQIVERDVFSYGDNSGLQCRGELRVRFAGSGARWRGYVRTNLRYVGSPGWVGQIVQNHQIALQQITSR
jgi:hypothetical protein